jgi:hypothetical protein
MAGSAGLTNGSFMPTPAAVVTFMPLGATAGLPVVGANGLGCRERTEPDGKGLMRRVRTFDSGA